MKKFQSISIAAFTMLLGVSLFYAQINRKPFTDEVFVNPVKNPISKAMIYQCQKDPTNSFLAYSSLQQFNPYPSGSANKRNSNSQGLVFASINAKPIWVADNGSGGLGRSVTLEPGRYLIRNTMNNRYLSQEIATLQKQQGPGEVWILRYKEESGYTIRNELNGHFLSQETLKLQPKVGAGEYWKFYTGLAKDSKRLIIFNILKRKVLSQEVKYLNNQIGPGEYWELVSLSKTEDKSPPDVISSDHTVKLTKLVCNSQEGTFFDDNARLRVWVDGNGPEERQKVMGSGSTWTDPFEKGFGFSDNLYIELWDMDTADPPDLLGKLTIDSRKKSGEQRFLFKTADYVLFWQSN